MRNPDGSIIQGSQKAKMMSNATKAMDSIKGRLKRASSDYQMSKNDLTSQRQARKSANADPFTIWTSADDVSMAYNINATKSGLHDSLTSANALAGQYESLSTVNDDLANGTIADRMIADDSAKSASQSEAQTQMRIQSDPLFSASYSASQSASASFADLPKSKQSSLLNSLYQEKNNRNSGFNDAGVTNAQPLPPFQNSNNNGGWN